LGVSYILFLQAVEEDGCADDDDLEDEGVQVELLAVLVLKDEEELQHEDTGVLADEEVGDEGGDHFEEGQPSQQVAEPLVANADHLHQYDVADQIVLLIDWQGERAANVLHQAGVLEDAYDYR
jgi:hypothetical protein